LKVEYRIGDSVEVLKEYPENHFDSCVTDPPYGLEFMGKAWDKIAVYDFSKAWATEVLRVLKPGAWLLAFGGTRTYHRMTCALEDAGFEVRDCMMFIYGSGFPKSHDVSKAIDKTLGAEREVVGEVATPWRTDNIGKGVALQSSVQEDFTNHGKDGYRTTQITAPATPEALKWQGWGTALKPAWEPIVVCRKPLIGTVAENVLEHGTGGINVDGCRIPSGTEHFRGRVGPKVLNSDWKERSGFGSEFVATDNPLGRWPSNLLLDVDSAKLLDEQSGESLSCGGRTSDQFRQDNLIYGKGQGRISAGDPGLGDFGGASRFFYTAKASRSEREKGVKTRDDFPQCAKNFHPTVKPLDLMQYLVRLVTPTGGVCLDPFLGSGTTLLACRLEGFAALGIEKNAEYEPIIKGRLEYIPPALDTFDRDVTPHPHPPAENDASKEIPRTVRMSGE
jgi:site-specific DNA-methyltransferase (adenine-specific)